MNLQRLVSLFFVFGTNLFVLDCRKFVSYSFVTMARGIPKNKDEAREQICTIHLAKLTHKVTFKKKAPRAIREIKKFAQKAMGTDDVRVLPEVNKYVWASGVRKTPRRIRVKLQRKRQMDKDSNEKLVTFVNLVEVPSFKGLLTETV